MEISEDVAQDFIGIQDNVELTELIVYPNPSRNGSFVINMPETAYIKNIRLFTFSGLVHEEKVNETTRNHSISHRLPSGYYLVQISTDAKVYREKLLIH